MNYDDLTNSQLVALHDDLLALNELRADAPFFLGDGTRRIGAESAVIIRDGRMCQLIGFLVVETYFELRRRFSREFPSKTPADQTTPET